jgi:hypothetical protein
MLGAVTFIVPARVWETPSDPAASPRIHLVDSAAALASLAWATPQPVGGGRVGAPRDRQRGHGRACRHGFRGVRLTVDDPEERR